MCQVLSLAWARPQELTRLLGQVVISQGDRPPSRKAQGWIHLQVEIANQKICVKKNLYIFRLLNNSVSTYTVFMYHMFVHDHLNDMLYILFCVNEYMTSTFMLSHNEIF